MPNLTSLASVPGGTRRPCEFRQLSAGDADPTARPRVPSSPGPRPTAHILPVVLGVLLGASPAQLWQHRCHCGPPLTLLPHLVPGLSSLASWPGNTRRSCELRQLRVGGATPTALSRLPPSAASRPSSHMLRLSLKVPTRCWSFMPGASAASPRRHHRRAPHHPDTAVPCHVTRRHGTA